MDIRPIEGSDRAAVAGLIEARWAGRVIVTRRRAVDAAGLPGFVAVEGDRLLGCATLQHEGDELQIVSMDTVEEELGVGTALVDAAVARARELGVRRVWLCTTNDNLPALRFWQRRAFRIVAVHRDSIEAARAVKPAIPDVGHMGIPIRDELELELVLG